MWQKNETLLKETRYKEITCMAVSVVSSLLAYLNLAALSPESINPETEKIIEQLVLAISKLPDWVKNTTMIASAISTLGTIGIAFEYEDKYNELKKHSYKLKF